MRPIKFRCWVKMSQTMQDWDSLLEKRDRLKRLIFAHNSEQDYILMQFTGLLDKNGKEIYEGDIVVQTIKDAVDNNRGTIIFSKDKGCYAIDYGNNIFSVIYAYENIMKSCQVIGNIYENPNLLSK